MTYTLYQKYLLFRSKMGVIIRSIKYKGKVPLTKKIYFMFKGFLAESYLIYDFQTNDFRYYLSDYERAKSRFINGSSATLLNDKIIFEDAFSPYIYVPKTIATIYEGNFLPTFKLPEVSDIDDLINHCSNDEKVVFKPYKESDGGRGVFFLSVVNGHIYLDSEKVTKKELIQRIEGLNNYIVSEYIYQDEFSSSFYPDTANTIRILSMRDPYTKKPFIAYSVYRIGTKKSAPIDAWFAGGVCSKIDISTGELGKGVLIDKGKKTYVDYHPDTKAKITGTFIPNWEEVKKKVLSASTNFPDLKYVAWDIVIGKNDIVALEGNNCSNVNFLQVHEPLLVNKKVNEFYKFHGII